MLRRIIRSLGSSNKVTELKVSKMNFKWKERSAFYETVRFTLFLCRCVGLLPISGLAQENSALTRHTFKSLYTIIYVPSLASRVFWLGINSYDNLVNGFDLRRFCRIFFGTITMTSEFVMILFCRDWNGMIEKIELLEATLPPLRNAASIVKRINIFTIAVFLCAFVEQLIFLIFTIQIVVDCYAQPNDSGLYIQSYFVAFYGWYYNYFPFDFISAVILKVSSTQLNFMWSFMDVLIMVFCLYLVNRFNDFNYLMAQNQRHIIKNGTTRLPWQELQVHYTRLVRLVKIVDGNINSFVFMSFLSNFCLIAQHVFFLVNSLYKQNYLKFSECVLSHSTHWLTELNTVVTMTYLIGRTLMLAFIAAHVHTLSREPLNALHTVPASAYTYDLQRFMDQVYHTNVSISGLGYFHVTRGMILSVVATLVTYNLVLVQF